MLQMLNPLPIPNTAHPNIARGSKLRRLDAGGALNIAIRQRSAPSYPAPRQAPQTAEAEEVQAQLLA